MRMEWRLATLGFGRIGVTAISAAIAVSTASGAVAQAVLPTMTDQYLLNFYDYRQPDPLTGTTAITLAQGVGGGFLPDPSPSTWGSTPTFAQAQAFGNTTTITAEQNGVSIGNLSVREFSRRAVGTCERDWLQPGDSVFSEFTGAMEPDAHQSWLCQSFDPRGQRRSRKSSRDHFCGNRPGLSDSYHQDLCNSGRYTARNPVR